MAEPIIVGVTGGSGSGKTLFIKRLMNEVTSLSLHSMDNYYIERGKQPKDKLGFENFDTLQSINQEKFIQDLEQLKKGESVELQEYTYNNSASVANTIRIDSKPVILVEGIFALHIQEIRKLLDLKIYIDVPDFLMLKRRIIRDAKERGYDMNDVLYRFEKHVYPSFKTYIEPSKKWADLIIPNHDNFDAALKVVSTFLKSINA